MAGLGGRTRQSHTKSRKGCRTCKRRHIRCDENFPQCRNCTKHGCRCDYRDLPTSAQESSRSPREPDLQYTAEAEQDIDEWQRTGIFPFPELRVRPEPQWRVLSATDLRLVHHIASVATDMQLRGYGHCNIWTAQIPTFLSIASSHEFVMSSVLAFSAAHLAWMTGSSETNNLAYYHRGIALKGLQEAIGSFSRQSSDAVLAASILLSWQATEWRSWASLMQGTFTVINAMQPWKEESRFLRFIDEHLTLPSPQALALAPATTIGHEETLLLGRAYHALTRIHPYTTSIEDGSRRAEELMTFLQSLRGVSTPTSEQLFEVLQPLRAWLFWLPTTMLQNPHSNSITMALLAQFYATALAVDPLFPVLGGAYLGSLSSSPLEEIDRILYSRQTNNPYDEEVQIALSMMDFPREMALTFRDRLSYPGQTYGAATDQSSPYNFHGLSLGSKSTTPGSSNGPPSGYHHSLEDLGTAPRLQSHYAEPSPRPSIRGFEERTFAGFSVAEDSPGYSPGYVDDEQYRTFSDPSWSYNGGFVAPTLWT